MKAILVENIKNKISLKVGETEKPVPKPDEILVEVKAFGINRADLLQKKGKYPPPKGASEILGLEIAGVVAEMGSGVNNWKIGDRVFGLLPGGGYAQYAVIHKDMPMPIPANMSFTDAGAVPEVFLTAYQALVWLGELRERERVLIHAGASGVGTAAIQLAKTFNAEIYITASAPKHELSKSLGADIAIDYTAEDFSQVIKEQTVGKGMDVIIDFIGAPYFNQNIASLALEGRMVMLATLGGGAVENIDVRQILIKRLKIMGSTLRSRDLDYQARLTKEFWQFTEQMFIDGRLKPVIDTVYNWQDIEAAHERMEKNLNAGKIVMKVEE